MAVSQPRSHHGTVAESRASETSSEETLAKAFGRYEVRKLLGKGAYGAVYLGFDSQLHRHVAIKTPRLDVDSDTVEREFLAEARQLRDSHCGPSGGPAPLFLDLLRGAVPCDVISAS